MKKTLKRSLYEIYKDNGKDDFLDKENLHNGDKNR